MIRVLHEAMPEVFPGAVPSLSTISRSAHLCRFINMAQAVKFCENSNHLGIYFDGTQKNGDSITAVILMNEFQQSLAVSAEVTVHQDAESVALDIQAAIFNLGIYASEAGLLPDVNPFRWCQEQMKKVKIVLTDSCPTAKKCAKEVCERLHDFFEFDEEIVILDCALHLILNFEKQCYKVLSIEPFEALKSISNLLSSQTPTRNSWRSKHPELANLFSRVVGVRFSQMSGNALNLIKHWDTLYQFFQRREAQPSVLNILSFMTRNASIVFSEALALAFIYYLLVEPAWKKMQNQELRVAINTCDQLTSVANTLVVSSDPADLLTSPTSNPFIRVDPDTSTIITSEVSELSAALLSEKFDELYFRTAITKMAAKGSAYIETLRKNWEDDLLPLGQRGLSLSNQVTERYFGVLDFILKNHQSKALSSRCELVKAKFNGAYEYLRSLGHTNALKVIAHGQKYRAEMIKLNQNADAAVNALRLEKERHLERQVFYKAFPTLV